MYYKIFDAITWHFFGTLHTIFFVLILKISILIIKNITIR